MFTCQNKGDYLSVEVSGPYSLDVLISALYEVADHLRKENLEKVLIEMRNMDGNPSILDRYQIGVEMAKTLGPRYKVALITRPEVVNRMAENTAVNRGSKVKAFTNLQDAMVWLGINQGNGDLENEHG